MVARAGGGVFIAPSITEVIGGVVFYGSLGDITALGSIKIAQYSLPPSVPAQGLEKGNQHSQLGSNSV